TSVASNEAEVSEALKASSELLLAPLVVPQPANRQTQNTVDAAIRANLVRPDSSRCPISKS
ncbi:MAG: hypothetical protein IJH88_09055, partial [Eggerthellaceae bacterium]|nr:hypothetical protein [Eggerthellaceae bacterium]